MWSLNSNKHRQSDLQPHAHISLFPKLNSTAVSLLLVSCATQPTAILAVLPIVSAMDISISEIHSSRDETDHLTRLGDEVTQEAPKGSDSSSQLRS